MADVAWPFGAPREPPNMTTQWANLLTLARLASAIPCALAVAHGRWVAAAWLFAFAAFSDLADGPLARRTKNASAFGALLDHTTDAVFVAIVLAALQVQGYIPWILPALVVTAFIQYVMDSEALAGHRLRASWLGRSNGIAYYVLVGIPLIRNALELNWPSDAVISLVGWLLVISTAASMADRGFARWRASGAER